MTTELPPGTHLGKDDGEDDIHSTSTWPSPEEASGHTVMNCFGLCWDWKEDVPVASIEERVNQLLAQGATEIGLALVDDGSDTYLLLVTDQREVPSGVLDDIWDAWWRTRYSDEDEDRNQRCPEELPLRWPL